VFVFCVFLCGFFFVWWVFFFFFFCFFLRVLVSVFGVWFCVGCVWFFCWLGLCCDGCCCVGGWVGGVVFGCGFVVFVFCGCFCLVVVVLGVFVFVGGFCCWGWWFFCGGGRFCFGGGVGCFCWSCLRL
ncbi:hypothetical protein RA264_27840, partial [Pseudomonas syringae pv. tagetis]|uniref:hypothetical protein n=1 Tax=Pseudomonas syringae group genomosp. 7 TaxID=251699 RepID=UPI00376FE651